MREAAFQDPNEYLQETEYVVQHHYLGIEKILSHFKEAQKYWSVSQLNESKTPEYKTDLKKYLELQDAGLALDFSESTFAGGILQIAYMGIKTISKNKDIPEKYRKIIGKNDKVSQFCIGEERHGLPSGLIVFAGRHQYNHWDEEPKKTVKNIFQQLEIAHIDNMSCDLAFSLGNPGIINHANWILMQALGWATYDRYLLGMRDLIYPYKN